MADPSLNKDSTLSSNPLKHDPKFTSDPVGHDAPLISDANLISNPLKHDASDSLNCDSMCTSESRVHDPSIKLTTDSTPASDVLKLDPSLDINSHTSDPPLSIDFTFTSKFLKDGEGELTDEWILRPRPLYQNLPNIEDVHSKYKEIILTLPKEERWVTSTLRYYKGFWKFEEILPGLLAVEEAFQARPNDVILTSFVKSGTTWLKALTFTIVHRNKFPLSRHPLLKLSPHDCVPFLEYHYASRDEQYLETLPSPRVLSTHASYSTLPESIRTSTCPIIYICREPKDVLVSVWHMVAKFEWIQKSFTFDQAFELFCEGRIPHGPIWDHMLEYYNQSLQNADKILFLKYEEMMMDPIDGAQRVASFLGCPFSEEEVRNGVVEAIVEFCSFNKIKDLDVNKDGGNHYFFRKAVVGDWQNHMTAEMATRLDEITKQKLQNSGLTFELQCVDK